MNFNAWVSAGLTLFISFASAANAAIPDFSGSVYQQGATFGLVLSPPKDHHFNLEAPYSATVEAKKIVFRAIEKTQTQLTFEANAPSLVVGDEVAASVFLCDDAKTYCVKKKQTFALKPTISKPEIEVKDESPVVTPKKLPASRSKNASAHQDRAGFWDNAILEAFQESVRTRKPVMIDFYGIWCPPCNQYNETVFPSPAFKTAAQNYVLLKIDADAEISWDLKSHFKIGGYPTLLIVKAPNAYASTADVKKLEEIDRIVGFFATGELTKRMKDGYANRNQRFEDRILLLKANYLDGLQRLIEVKWEQKDFASAVAFADEGSKTRPDELYFQLIKLQGQAKDHPEVMKERASLELINKISEQSKTLGVDTLLRAQDLIVSNSDHLKPEIVLIANSILNSLAERVNSKTLTVEGYELSIADIDALKVDVAIALKDEAMQKRARGQTVGSYQKLIALNGQQESRGLNLEFAYWLWNNQQVDEAKKIYDRFIKKYPKEFTFYFASAKMNLELKHLPEARAQAEKAVDFSYGDNRLRSMERLVRVLIASGEPALAVEKGNALLAQVKDPKGYLIRTDRYIVALKKAVDAAQKELENRTKA
jgi:thiol-disulfide isomerase/thioredoxin